VVAGSAISGSVRRLNSADLLDWDRLPPRRAALLYAASAVAFVVLCLSLRDR
jgi:hypothetical protein